MKWGQLITLGTALTVVQSGTELPSEFNYEIHIKWMQNYLKGAEWQIRQRAERKES